MIPDCGAKIPHASWPKNIKQKHSSNKFNEDFEMVHIIDIGNLKPVLCDNLEGLDGVGGGGKFQERRHMYTYD